jgi:hypothetical protein
MDQQVTLMPLHREAGLQQAESTPHRALLGGQFGLIEQAFQLVNFISQRQFGRQAAGISEDAVGHPQFIRHPGIVIQCERLATARKIIEFSALVRLAGSLL